MKKSRLIFWIVTSFIAAVTIAAAAFSCRVSAALCAVCVCLGAAAATFFCLKFRAAEYSVENGCIVIRGGVLIKSEQKLPIESVLWKTTVKLGKAALFTVIHTASGKAVLFTSEVV